MNDLRLPQQDSATGRGLKTGIQAMIGFLGTFGIGFIMSVWNVPGVPDAIISYVEKNLGQTLLLIGIPSGVTGFIWNWFRPGVKNY